MASSSAQPNNSAAAAAATSTTTSNNSSSCYYPTPIPVRVDVKSDDKNVRIIDTLLIDPTCWPIPLYTPLRQSVEANVREYAHTILSDTEVQGMGRTVRHFTGRVDLYTSQLQTKIEDQLRPQLLAIATGNLPKPKQDPLTKISIRLIVHGGIEIHEDLFWDCSVPLSPFDFAKDMVEEWNLPEQAVVPIATTILEQLYYHDDMKMDTSPDLTLQASNESAEATATANSHTSDTTSNFYSNNTNMEDNTSTSKTTTTARRGAWQIDHKENVALMGQLVAHHKLE